MASKRRIAEQVKRILGVDAPIQEIILLTSQAYAFVVKKNWWNNKREGENDVNGNFIYSFDDISISLDSTKNLYYATLPSSFLGDLPHEMGIPHVSFVESLTTPFIRLANGHPALFRGLQSEKMGNNDTFFVENDKVYLPTMTAVNSDKKLLMKLVVGLQGIGDEENIAIPPDVELEIINTTISLYGQNQTKKG